MKPTELRMARLKARIKAKAIAAALGVSPGQFSRWETGRDVPPEHRVLAWKRALVKALR